MDIADLAARGVVLLGCGKMGTALLKGWLAGGLPASAVSVLEPNVSPRLEALAREGVRLNDFPPEPPGIAVVAVKPQSMGAALPRLVAYGGGGTLFVSIAAGTPIRAFEAALGVDTPIVRAMPNTPAAIRRGMTALVGSGAVDEEGMRVAETLMAAVGETARLDAEDQMDAVTAVSGSGPAYVFLMIEALAAAGEAEGLAPELALRLARATVTGAARLAEAPDREPSRLRVDVTSPGGTTAAALEILMDERDGLAPLMRRGVAAAAARSRALAG